MTGFTPLARSERKTLKYKTLAYLDYLVHYRIPGNIAAARLVLT